MEIYEIGYHNLNTLVGIALEEAKKTMPLTHQEILGLITKAILKNHE